MSMSMSVSMNMDDYVSITVLDSPPVVIPQVGRFDVGKGVAFALNVFDTVRNCLAIEFQRGCPRGNHYHTQKTEALFVLSGCIHAQFFFPPAHAHEHGANHSSGGCSEADAVVVKRATLLPGTLVVLKPGIAHSYVSSEPSSFGIELSPDPFDPADTFPVAPPPPLS
eukprot:ANDGO_02984.mRNA.1 hypothetical protein